MKHFVQDLYHFIVVLVQENDIYIIYMYCFTQKQINKNMQILFPSPFFTIIKFPSMKM